jgi:glycine betaine transporter
MTTLNSPSSDPASTAATGSEHSTESASSGGLDDPPPPSGVGSDSGPAGAETASLTDPSSNRVGKVFVCAVGLVIAFVLWAAIAPEALADIMTRAMTAVSTGFGWIYLVVPFAAIVMLVWFAVSRFGRLRLGAHDSRPEYRTVTWLAMILAAVMGIGLVSYGVAEPMSHFMVPPHGLAEPETMDAAVRAMQFSYLDWGFQAWAIFGVFGLAIGYSTHRKGRPALVSTMLRPVLGRLVDGWVGSFIDILTIIATLFGTTTSLGLGASQIGEGLNTVFGIDATIALQIIVISVLTLLFTGSALTGVSRGIKYISQITLTMATLLGLFVFITGPSGFISNLFVRSVGAFAGDFLELSFMTPTNAEDSEWMLGWTYFMMAWWLSWSAFVGIFLAKISKGRTIREFVAGVLLVPSVVFFVWFTVMGGSAIKFDIDGAAIGEATQDNLDTAFFSPPRAASAVPVRVGLHDHHGHPVLRLLRRLEHVRPQFAVLARLLRTAPPGHRDLGIPHRCLRDRAAPRRRPAGSPAGGDALSRPVHRHRGRPRRRPCQRAAQRRPDRRGGRSRKAGSAPLTALAHFTERTTEQSSGPVATCALAAQWSARRQPGATLCGSGPGRLGECPQNPWAIRW